MFDKLELFNLAGDFARHASLRQSTIAQNMANADTPGYRARDVQSFAESYREADGSDMRQTRAGHSFSARDTADNWRLFDAPGPSAPNGNTVSLETEMMKATEVRHQHDMALSVYSSSMDILRTAIGRGR